MRYRIMLQGGVRISSVQSVEVAERRLVNPDATAVSCAIERRPDLEFATPGPWARTSARHDFDRTESAIAARELAQC